MKRESGTRGLFAGNQAIQGGSNLPWLDTYRGLNESEGFRLIDHVFEDLRKAGSVFGEANRVV